MKVYLITSCVCYVGSTMSQNVQPRRAVSRWQQPRHSCPRKALFGLPSFSTPIALRESHWKTSTWSLLIVSGGVVIMQCYERKGLCDVECLWMRQRERARRVSWGQDTGSLLMRTDTRNAWMEMELSVRDIVTATVGNVSVLYTVE